MIRLLIISTFLGISLAMDAFSVSVANGLHEVNMSKKKITYMSLIFASFQALMPLIGWVCVHYLLNLFEEFEKCVPFIALFLLLFIGGKMLYEGIKNQENSVQDTKITTILMQGVATSIDALSVGFTIGEYTFFYALTSITIIGLITFIICYLGALLGKKFSNKLANKATILGGIILILIGIEIFLTGIL